MIPHQSAIRFLASVRSVAEAQLVVAHGADIVDCKQPDRGALGALDPTEVAAVRRAVPDRIPVSATVGDDACGADDLETRVQTMAESGANFVKIGFDGAAPWRHALRRLKSMQKTPCRLVAVLLADKSLDFEIIEACKRAGFAGVLLDTADKKAGALPDVTSAVHLRAFVAHARNNQLFAGLAGALRAQHIVELAALKPDVLGFRGALCHDHGRQNEIDPVAVAALRRTLDQAGYKRVAHNTSLEVHIP